MGKVIKSPILVWFEAFMYSRNLQLFGIIINDHSLLESIIKVNYAIMALPIYYVCAQDTSVLCKWQSDPFCLQFSPKFCHACTCVCTLIDTKWNEYVSLLFYLLYSLLDHRGIHFRSVAFYHFLKNNFTYFSFGRNSCKLIGNNDNDYKIITSSILQKQPAWQGDLPFEWKF